MFTPEAVTAHVLAHPGVRLGHEVDIAAGLAAVRAGAVVVGRAMSIDHREAEHYLYPPARDVPAPPRLPDLERLHPDSVEVLRYLAKHKHATEAEIAKALHNGRVLPARGEIRRLLWAGQIVPDPNGKGYTLAKV